MKITKTNKEVSEKERNRLIANQGCDVCPCCGHKKKFPSFIYKSWCKGFFKMRNMRVDCYYCDECGAEWESDPYEY